MDFTIPTEEVEQRQVVQYLEYRDCKFTAIPNSTYTKSWKQKQKNTATGLRAGFPDLVAIINGTFICIEMKRSVGSATSSLQKDWHKALLDAGIPTYVCKGFLEAKKVIDSYLIPS